ncbi:MAG: hypothetical protein GY797_25910 [Deltaproteobacteria bacterium]|nr:hypothetical protein [Deltaproteobacteria bacterium]
MAELLILGIILFWGLVGGIVGGIIAKWPGKTVARNVLKGFFLSISTLVVFLLFLILVLKVSTDWFSIGKLMGTNDKAVKSRS